MGFKPGDEKRLVAPPDWIGVNYYNRFIVRSAEVAPNASVEGRFDFLTFRGFEGPITDKGWEVWPKGLYDIVSPISARYKLRIEITENGCGYGDRPDAHGRVPDVQRIAYYRDHLRKLSRAISDGANLHGSRPYRPTVETRRF